MNHNSFSFHTLFSNSSPFDKAHEMPESQPDTNEYDDDAGVTSPSAETDSTESSFDSDVPELRETVRRIVRGGIADDIEEDDDDDDDEYLDDGQPPDSPGLFTLPLNIPSDIVSGSPPHRRLTNPVTFDSLTDIIPMVSLEASEEFLRTDRPTRSPRQPCHQLSPLEEQITSIVRARIRRIENLSADGIRYALAELFRGNHIDDTLRLAEFFDLSVERQGCRCHVAEREAVDEEFVLLRDQRSYRDDLYNKIQGILDSKLREKINEITQQRKPWGKIRRDLYDFGTFERPSVNPVMRIVNKLARIDEDLRQVQALLPIELRDKAPGIEYNAIEQVQDWERRFKGWFFKFDKCFQEMGKKNAIQEKTLVAYYAAKKNDKWISFAFGLYVDQVPLSSLTKAWIAAFEFAAFMLKNARYRRAILTNFAQFHKFGRSDEAIECCEELQDLYEEMWDKFKDTSKLSDNGVNEDAQKAILEEFFEKELGVQVRPGPTLNEI
ncbi:hypothetical protein M501DRAFT_57460 [Patellaria atrata CBS 101060]|uniref:Uncharacterized protein n=1 Tax=Patellaria atrata CBS 101060 TaxID=1346257 RepID=A0A9P4SIV7_9PEZI|nr:hypothetical protein M501DRAFT_57460 [Patellaria atrata CBS 101060]